MKRLLFFVCLAIAISTEPRAASGSPPQHDSATAGGWVLYYDEDWNLVGEWYKPCQGPASRWGVVGVNVEIDEFYSCEGGPEPPDCIPVIVYDNGIGETPNPSLVCGIGL